MQNLQKRQNSEGKSTGSTFSFVQLCLKKFFLFIIFFLVIESMAGYFYYEHEGFSKKSNHVTLKTGVMAPGNFASQSLE